MKRRDLLKTGLLAPVAMGLCGCGKNETAQKSQSKDFEIIPKQTETFKFSIPMPFNFETIDEVSELNKKYKKSQVATLYNNVPLPLSEKFNGWIQIDRGANPDIKSYDDFGKYAKYAMEKGFNVCYVMNSPKAMSERDFKSLEREFFRLFDYMTSIGIKDFKIANVQLLSAINNHIDIYKSGISLGASTAFEYHSVSQYQNLIEQYPNINFMDVSFDENYNFRFLRNLRKMFPKKGIELVLNDTCIRGCPAKITHHASERFCLYECQKIRRTNPTLWSFKSPVVYPWNLEYYSAIGVNHFKFMPTTGQNEQRGNYRNLDALVHYLDCAEFGKEHYRVNDFFQDLFYYYDKNFPEHITISQIEPYLLDIKYFIKHGHECNLKCDVECHYCNKKAQEMESFLRTIGVSV